MTVLSIDEIEYRLKSMPLWRLVDGKLVRSFEAKNFAAAMGFLVAVGTIADHSHHHPDIHLTEYRQVEVILHTPRENGLTEMDFEMAHHIDNIPVAYSMKWAHAHADVISADPQSQSPLTRLKKYDSVFKHTHREGDIVHTNYTSPELATTNHQMPLHAHPFSVHGTSSTHTDLGQSDVFRHREHSNPRYETESMHMQLRDDNAASAESVPADSSASIHPHIDSLTGYHMAHIVFRNKHPSNFESDEENAAWEKMSEGLQTLIDKGYDVGMSSSILPMVNAHQVYPNWEESMHEAYVHLQRRLSPSWAKDEGPEVVEAAKKFVDGYCTIFK